MSERTNMLAHLWAHQRESSGSNNGGNFYFRGKNIYSFGPHFRCASVETNRHGKRAYLVTTCKYSTTTAKHMNFVRQAIPCGETVFNTPRAVSLSNGRFRFAGYREAAYAIIDKLEEIDACIDAQQRARTEDYREQVGKCLRFIGSWVAFWGLDRRQKSAEGRWLMPVLDKLRSPGKRDIAEFWHVAEISERNVRDTWKTDKSKYRDLLDDILSRDLIQTTAVADFGQRVDRLFLDRTGDPELWVRFEARCLQQAETNRRNNELREQRRIERRERRRLEAEANRLYASLPYEEKQKLWHEGKIITTNFYVPSELGYNALLRVYKGRVETSLGIRIKVREAARLWALVDHFHRNEAEFRHDLVLDADNNQWTINSYSDDIMTAGCHRIPYLEMHEAARQLGIAS